MSAAAELQMRMGRQRALQQLDRALRSCEPAAVDPEWTEFEAEALRRHSEDEA
jgi:hypothetical protein